MTLISVRNAGAHLCNVRDLQQQILHTKRSAMSVCAMAASLWPAHTQPRTRPHSIPIPTPTPTYPTPGLYGGEGGTSGGGGGGEGGGGEGMR